ncbi:MAG: hypothetical protein ACFFCQ_08390 [Promethearchaeota archaeon]
MKSFSKVIIFILILIAIQISILFTETISFQYINGFSTDNDKAAGLDNRDHQPRNTFGENQEKNNSDRTTKTIHTPTSPLSVNITVLYPNGGEVLSGLVNISWYVNYTSTQWGYLIEVSPDAGATCYPLTAGVSSTEITTYSWNTAQHKDGQDYLIHVTASTLDWTISDTSDHVFTLENYPTYISEEIDGPNNTYTFSPDIKVNLNVSRAVNVSIEYLLTVPVHIPTTLDPIGIYLDITFSNKDALNGLWINVSKIELGEFDPTNVKVYSYNPTTESWETVKDTGYDMDNEVVYGFTDHVTLFGVMDEQAETQTDPTELLIYLGGGFVLVLILIQIATMIFRKAKKEQKYYYQE